MAKNPDDRPPTPADLRRGLDECIDRLEDRAPSAKAEATFALPEEAPSPAKPYLDENVQFTVFRPGSIEPLKWYPLVAFAHLSAKRPDAPEDEPDLPITPPLKKDNPLLLQRDVNRTRATLLYVPGVHPALLRTTICRC